MHRSRPLSVLVVDDNKDGAETLAVLLEAYGYRVRTALDGDAALSLARAVPPDAVILDLGLPGMDGFTLAEALCAMLDRRPLLIVVSGFTDLRAECLALGMDYYLFKPVDPTHLNDLLSSHAAKLAKLDRPEPTLIQASAS
jgi:CheY-like chemotaxis protein